MLECGCERRRREAGSALFVTMMFLVLMGALGLAGLDTVARDQEVAGLQNRAAIAFYAAEAGGAQARSLVRGVTSRSDTPAFPTQGAPALLGDGETRSHGVPSYYGDPAVTAPVRWIRDGLPYAQGGNLQMGGQQLVHTLWQIDVVGRNGGGAASQLELVETKVLSKGY